MNMPKPPWYGIKDPLAIMHFKLEEIRKKKMSNKYVYKVGIDTNSREYYEVKSDKPLTDDEAREAAEDSDIKPVDIKYFDDTQWNVELIKEPEDLSFFKVLQPSMTEHELHRKQTKGSNCSFHYNPIERKWFGTLLNGDIYSHTNLLRCIHLVNLYIRDHHKPMKHNEKGQCWIL